MQTGSSIWAPKAAQRAARSCSRARPSSCSRQKIRSPVSTCGINAMARVIIRFTMSSKRKIAPTEEFASGSAMFLPGITSDCFGNEALGSFQDPGDPNEDDSANKGDDDRANHPSGRPDAQTAEKPAAKPATDDAEKDIHD